jgi:hypothetical protein
LPFSVNGVATSAQTCSGTGTTRTCSYTIQSTDSGAITIAANALSGSLSDAAGNAATLSHAAVTTPVITVDTVALTVSIPDLFVDDDTGSSSTDNITSKATVTLNGTAKAGATVTLYTGSTCASGSEVGTPQTATGGTYSFSSVALSAGSNTFRAGATDGLNPAVCSDPISITRDSSAPSVAFTGSSTTISADTTTLDGTASDANGIASVTASSSDGGPNCSIGGTVTAWTCALTGITAGGPYTYTATATDIAGNTTTSTSFSLTRSTSAPTLSLSSSTPTLPTAGGLTNAATLNLSLTATPTGGASSISSVEVSTDGTTFNVPTTLSGVTWNTASLSLTNGNTYTLKARATDNLGNVSDILTIDTFTVDRTAPSISVTSPANATYGSGQNLDFVATMSEATTVDITNGTPRIALTIGSTTQYATYLSGSGTTSLTFRYITQSGDNDTDGIAVTSPVQLNGGTLRDSAGNDATLTFTPPTTTGVLVDTIPPSISSIALDNPNSCGGDGICVTGDTLRYIITFSEPVTLTGAGTLTVPLTFTSGAASAVYTNSTPTTTSTVTVSRTILAGDTHTTGNITLATPLTLSTLTIADAAGNAASLTHASTSLGGILINNAPLPVNTVASTVSGVGYNGQTMTCNAGTWTGSPTGYAYKWYSSAAEILGQTASTYTVTSATEGTAITCAAAGTNAGGTSAYTMASNTIENWVPGDLSTPPVGWFDAADQGSLGNSGNNTTVAAWSNKGTEGGSASQGTPTNQPIYDAVALSGTRPGILFDGVNDNLIINTTVMRGNTSHALFWVFQPNGTPSSYSPTISGKPTNGFTDVGAIHYIKSSSRLGASYPYYYASSAFTSYDLSTGTQYVFGQAQIMAFQNDTSGWGIFRNGELEGKTNNLAVPNTNTNGYILGKQISPQRHAHIVLSEVIIVTDAGNDLEIRKKIEGYLAHKWGLTANLPVGHSYKTTPPTVP